MARQVAGTKKEPPLRAQYRVHHDLVVQAVAAHQVVRILHLRPVRVSTRGQESILDDLRVHRGAGIRNRRIEIREVGIQPDGVVHRLVHGLERLAGIAEDEKGE